MSTKKRIENMTKDYMIECKGAHPAYVQGYNPRHFNYLKNSGHYTNKNPLNFNESPNLLKLGKEQIERLA